MKTVQLILPAKKSFCANALAYFAGKKSFCANAIAYFTGVKSFSENTLAYFTGEIFFANALAYFTGEFFFLPTLQLISPAKKSFYEVDIRGRGVGVSGHVFVFVVSLACRLLIFLVIRRTTGRRTFRRRVVFRRQTQGTLAERDGSIQLTSLC